MTGRSMDFKNAKLDFSEFHPLDHFAGDRRCRSLPGGFLRHVRLWWDYQGPGWNPDDWEDVTDEIRKTERPD